MYFQFFKEKSSSSEKYNSVLEDILRFYVSPDQSDWDLLLPAAEFAVNNSKNESTGLVQGQHPLNPISQCVGKLAVKLQLPPEYRIHPVFHV